MNDRRKPNQTSRFLNGTEDDDPLKFSSKSFFESLGIVAPMEPADESSALSRQVGAIVLCGGLSRRMGRSKALLPFQGEALATRVSRLVRERVGGRVVVVAAQDQELPALAPGVEIARDQTPSRGPLEGFRTGLDAIGDDCEFVYLTATDSPFLASGWIDRLSTLIGSHAAAVPFVDSRHAPLAALYRPASVRPAIRRLLAENRLRMLLLLAQIPVRVVLAGELADVDPLAKTLRNLNTPEDYRSALADENETDLGD